MERTRRTATVAVLVALGAWAWACTTPPKKEDKKPTPEVVTKTEVPVKKVEVSREAEGAFAEAVKLYHSQKKSGAFDYEQLLGHFQAALKLDPKLAEAHYNLGCIYEAMRQDDKAEQHYKQALALRGDLTLAAANWGALLARRGKLDQALTIYTRALSKNEKNSPVLLNMAAIYKRQKKYKQAIDTAGQVLVRDPTNLGAYRVMASVYYEMGDMDMSRLICLRGLKLKQDDPSLHNTLGLTLLALKKVPEALAQFRLALAQKPDMVPTLFNIAKIALDYRDFRVAKEEFERILQYEPHNRQAAVGLGIALRGVGELEAAQAQFKALASKYPKDPTPQQWLCRLALRNLSDSQLAKKECGKCVKLLGGGGDQHPCVAMYKEATQGIEMEKKMKEAEAKAMADQKAFEEKLERLAALRKETVDRAWAKAEKECGILPPAKLEGDKVEFVLDPLAVSTKHATKVKLIGAIFKGVKRINIGTIKVKFHAIDEHTLEMVVPKGLEPGAWDVLLTFKDKSEIYFQGGLWVGQERKCEEKKPKPEEKPGKTDEPAEGKPGEAGPADGKKPENQTDAGQGAQPSPGGKESPAEEPKAPGDVEDKQATEGKEKEADKKEPDKKEADGKNTDEKNTDEKNTEPREPQVSP
ncbi:MAG: tetratricopeptide repeat protein [Deltaproteobacteria bacterium]|nr:tetratricopeptide repeat protein [Deltaproteobacteria bacterium]